MEVVYDNEEIDLGYGARTPDVEFCSPPGGGAGEDHVITYVLFQSRYSVVETGSVNQRNERAQYYHLTSGTQLIPYSWFMALEQAGSQDWFKADAHMQRLHLIPDEAHPLHNPDHLPIGFSKTVFLDDPRGDWNISGSPALFCHTGELHASTKDRGRVTLYIDGGASMQNNPKFLEALLTSLAATASDDAKLSRFASAVLKEWINEESKARLKKAVLGLVETMKERSQPEIREWGLGRFDAFNRGSNLVFMPMDLKNEKALDAPVSIPPLWNVHLYDWVQ